MKMMVAESKRKQDVGRLKKTNFFGVESIQKISIRKHIYIKRGKQSELKILTCYLGYESLL